MRIERTSASGAAVMLGVFLAALCASTPLSGLQSRAAKDAVIVTLKSEPCPEGCADYTVTIAAEQKGGSVVYTGKDHVLVTGAHRAELTRAQAARLQNILRDAASKHTDTAAAGETVMVEQGPAGGMKGPSSDPRLFTALSQLAGVERWTKGNDETVASLRKEGWDFHSSDAQHAELLVKAAGDGNSTLVKQLLAAGMPPNARDAQKALPLTAAIEGHHPEVVQELLAAGADKSLKSADGESALEMANELGYDDIAALLK